MSGALEELRLPVLEMNCGCPEPEPVIAMLSVFFFFSLRFCIQKNKDKHVNKTKSHKWDPIETNLLLSWFLISERRSENPPHL